MNIDNSTEQQLGAAPDFMRGEMGDLAGNLIVKIDGMVESKQPEVTMIMLGPVESSGDHNCMGGIDGVLDSIFGHPIVVMPTIATVFNPLTLGGQFGGKCLGGVDAIAGTVGMDLTPRGCILMFKAKLGLHSFSPGETHLVDNSKFGSGSIT
jgi:hypothetical protein